MPEEAPVTSAMGDFDFIGNAFEWVSYMISVILKIEVDAQMA